MWYETIKGKGGGVRAWVDGEGYRVGWLSMAFREFSVIRNGAGRGGCIATGIRSNVQKIDRSRPSQTHVNPPRRTKQSRRVHRFTLCCHDSISTFVPSPPHPSP